MEIANTMIDTPSLKKEDQFKSKKEEEDKYKKEETPNLTNNSLRKLKDEFLEQEFKEMGNPLSLG